MSQPSSAQQITAEHIMKLLAVKHAEDIFIPECKSGSSDQGYCRLDAWVMPKSWTHMNCVGYEVKVSRYDFLNDNKWQNYLPFVNSMYFVCPTDLIKPEELPENVGLMWVSKNGARLYIKRKAVFQAKEIPVSLFQYILMHRCTINIEGRAYTREDNIEYWKSYIEGRAISLQVGRAASRALVNNYRENVDRVAQENQRLRERMNTYDDIRRVLVELDVNPESPLLSTWRVRNKIERLKRVVPEDLEHSVGRAIKSLNDLQEALTKLQEENTGG